MMTPETVCQEKGIDLVYFDGRGTNTPGMFNKNTTSLRLTLILTVYINTKSSIMN